MKSKKKQGGWIAHRGVPPDRTIRLTISANQAALYNVFTAAGSPATARPIRVTINAGVILQAGLTGGALPAGSTLYITNNGRIAGTGGGRTSNQGDGGEATAGTLGNGIGGAAGGDAVNLTCNTTIDNTAVGEIFGGGGQGGGGGAAAGSNPPAGSGVGTGGGGGAGQGYNNATGGAAGADNGVIDTPATAGGNGSSAGAGSGGTGGFRAGPPVTGWRGGDGGDGGTWGQAGSAGADGTLEGGAPGATTSADGGGAAGFAVRRNGFTVTWIAGNNGTQVKGSVA